MWERLLGSVILIIVVGLVLWFILAVAFPEIKIEVINTSLPKP